MKVEFSDEAKAQVRGRRRLVASEPSCGPDLLTNELDQATPALQLAGA